MSWKLRTGNQQDNSGNGWFLGKGEQKYRKVELPNQRIEISTEIHRSKWK